MYLTAASKSPLQGGTGFHALFANFTSFALKASNYKNHEFPSEVCAQVSSNHFEPFVRHCFASMLWHPIAPSSGGSAPRSSARSASKRMMQREWMWIVQRQQTDRCLVELGNQFSKQLGIVCMSNEFV